MDKNKQKLDKRIIRHNRVRSIVAGTSDRPRLSVYKANQHIYAQLIDDQNGRTLAQASSHEVKGKAKKSEVAGEVGKIIANKALGLNIKNVKFDRGGFAYHGRIKALADGARAGGLEF